MTPGTLNESLLNSNQNPQSTNNSNSYETYEESWCLFSCWSFFFGKDQNSNTRNRNTPAYGHVQAGLEPVEPSERPSEAASGRNGVSGLTSMPAPSGEWHLRGTADSQSDTASLSSAGNGSLKMPGFSSSDEGSSCNSTPKK